MFYQKAGYYQFCPELFREKYESIVDPKKKDSY